ncbi:Uxx-star family glutaredoxin-like (seleno)protein [uncultured Meiothermus sp.]|mgnify:CR=1 FL=1|jgi:glutaredoxin 3|uniref:Uxx-star family glutaredoxin-like (seleno)protein n=1 Tax=uncultured Meiothermus sp. TaxID=157471 RepID=UPI002625855D|nr:Uxx-star family glutaredoxin-like (seleno)protein [uncultured Meiothermus sp.]
MALELFGTRSCQFTAELREDLEWRGVEFVEYDVEADVQALSRMLALTQQRTVPVLLEDGEVKQIGWQGRGCVVGFDPDRRA